MIHEYERFMQSFSNSQNTILSLMHQKQSASEFTFNVFKGMHTIKVQKNLLIKKALF